MELPFIVAGVLFVGAVVMILLWRRIKSVWDGSLYERRSVRKTRGGL